MLAIKNGNGNVWLIYLPSDIVIVINSDIDRTWSIYCDIDRGRPIDHV